MNFSQILHPRWSYKSGPCVGPRYQRTAAPLCRGIIWRTRRRHHCRCPKSQARTRSGRISCVRPHLSKERLKAPLIIFISLFLSPSLTITNRSVTLGHNGWHDRASFGISMKTGSHWLGTLKLTVTTNSGTLRIVASKLKFPNT